MSSNLTLSAKKKTTQRVVFFLELRNGDSKSEMQRSGGALLDPGLKEIDTSSPLGLGIQVDGEGCIFFLYVVGRIVESGVGVQRFDCGYVAVCQAEVEDIPIFADVVRAGGARDDRGADGDLQVNILRPFGQQLIQDLPVLFFVGFSGLVVLQTEPVGNGSLLRHPFREGVIDLSCKHFMGAASP